MVSINAFRKVQKGKKSSFLQKQNHSPYYLHKLRKAMLLRDRAEKRKNGSSDAFSISL